MATLAITAAVLAGAGYFLGQQRPLLALAAPALAGMAYATLLALEFVLMTACGDSGSTQRPSMIDVIRAWVGELRCTPRIFCWQQPFRAHRFPDYLPSEPGGSAGVLLIHGYLCNRGLWNRWMAELKQAGIPFVAVSLEPMLGSISRYAEQIEAAARRLEAHTGRPFIVVAHSMGGLAARYWWTMNPGTRPTSGGELRVRRLITLGSPHGGTWLARFAHSKNARQMRINSEWLLALARDEPATHRSRITCFFSQTDNIVFPASRATLHEADNRRLTNVAHVAMLDHPAPWQELRRQLDRSD